MPLSCKCLMKTSCTRSMLRSMPHEVDVFDKDKLQEVDASDFAVGATLV